MSYDEFEHEDKIQNELRAELREAKQLLKEAVEFMNLVPNNAISVNGEIVDKYVDYYTNTEEETIDHYKLCSKIDEFLKEK